jgi:inosine-uridine nucleoside N-ribohydrolase
MTRKIILDVDTGTDDAIAIMMASMADELEVVALCSVFGNTTVENTTINTLKAAHAVGADTIPVYPGAPEPIAKNLSASRSQSVEEPVLNGTVVVDGKEVAINPDILPLENAVRKQEKTNAACFYVDYLRKTSEKITIVATGTLTNLGLAFIMAPDITEKIDEIVIMGGGVYKTNITASAEANFWKDPEAAIYVLNSGAKITLCTLDATHSAALTKEHANIIRKVGTVAAVFCANDIYARIESYNKYQPLERHDTAPIHDTLCVAYLLDPTILTRVELCSCEVDCSDGTCEGHLVVDTRHFTAGKNVNVVFEADPNKLASLIVKIFSRKGPVNNNGG